MGGVSKQQVLPASASLRVRMTRLVWKHASEDLEADVNGEIDLDGFAVLRRRFELVLPNGIDGALIEPHPNPALDTHMGWVAVLIDDQIDEHVAGELCLARLLGELRVDRREHRGCVHRTADVIHPATGVAPAAGTDS
jgi:hypothetical protein